MSRGLGSAYPPEFPSDQASGLRIVPDDELWDALPPLTDAELDAMYAEDRADPVAPLHVVHTHPACGHDCVGCPAPKDGYCFTCEMRYEAELDRKHRPFRAVRKSK